MNGEFAADERIYKIIYSICKVSMVCDTLAKDFAALSSRFYGTLNEAKKEALRRAVADDALPLRDPTCFIGISVERRGGEEAMVAIWQDWEWRVRSWLTHLYAIRHALHEPFVRDYTHGHSAMEVFGIAAIAERWCESRGLRVKDRPGMIVIDTSSKRPFPARYNSMRAVSSIKIVRKTRGWYLVGVSRDEMWQVQQVWTNYYLTPMQDDIVKEWLRRQYAVQAEKGGE